MFKAREIEWNVRSGKDPRWNASGIFRGSVTAGPPSAYYEHIRSKIKELKKSPPDDLIYSSYKL